MGIAKIKIGEMSLANYITSGVNNNILVFRPIPYAKHSSSAIDDIYSFEGIDAVEIVDADLDVEITDNSFTFSVGTDNQIKLAFPKDRFNSKSEALEFLEEVKVVYLLGNLTREGSSYTLIIRDSSGCEVHRTTPVTLEQASQIISTLDSTKDVQSEGFNTSILIPIYTNNP